jgi:hypothetical protein
MNGASVYCKARDAGAQGGFCRDEAEPESDYCSRHAHHDDAASTHSQDEKVEQVNFAASADELVKAAKAAAREISRLDAWLRSWYPEYDASGPVRGPLRDAAKRLRKAVKEAESNV